MIVLLSALVVLVAAVVLVIGMISGAFTLVYAGLALAGVGVVLLLIARYLGRSHHPALSDEPTPLPVTEPLGPAGDLGRLVEDPTSAFPIAGYDALWVTQIVPRLTGLSPDELAMVDARERGGRHRTGVLDAIAAVRRGDAPDLPDPPPATDEATSRPPAPPVVEARPADQPEAPAVAVPAPDLPAPELPAAGPIHAADDDPADEVVEPEPIVTDPEPVDDGDDEGDGDGDQIIRVPTFLGRPAAPIYVRRP